jgi:O-acetyl-ADP-ribose deacetylase (regulator of RNase III)
MGAGVAASIAQEFPEALREDEKSPYGEAGKLGEFSVCETDFGWIYNAYTQFRPGREDRKRLYDSIKSAFVKINEDVRTFSPEPFILGIPKIGAGLARGDWATIAGIINSASPSIQITLVEYE